MGAARLLGTMIVVACPGWVGEWGLFGGRMEIQWERRSFQKNLKSWRGGWILS